jgi:cytochrome bd ubiquinol oxidase subunit I
MDRPVEERKPGREGGRHDRVVEGRENRLARASALEEEDDFGRREEDRPAVDGARDDRLATVGEKLLCVFALSGLQASYENDPIDRAHVGQSRRVSQLVLLSSTALAEAHQDYLLQARQMQALSFVVHIPLVCFGIAFPALVLFVEWLYLRTGDELYRTLARRWTKVMAALFAAGVVTGTILSFELGLLWPAFTASFGSVFGLGFAIEGFSFFMEAIFIGIYIYGWDRLSPRAHFASGIPIAIAGFTGSLTVISVNGWMNHPTGFQLRDGKAVDVHPLQALFGNSYFWHELVHMYLAGYMVTGFLVAAAYAAARLRGRWGRYERTALAIPLAVAALCAPVQVLVGDWNGRAVARAQPTKLAAFEGLGETRRGAPVHLLGWYREGRIEYGIPVPRLLSLLAYHDPDARVAGLDAVRADERPPVNVVRIAFQTMVGIGTLLALLGLFFLAVRWRRKRLPESRWFYGALVLAGPLSVVALICGWVTTEVGRQPWVVYRVMRTSEAVTGAGGIPIGYATLALVYLVLALAVAWILLRLARAPLDPAPVAAEEP